MKVFKALGRLNSIIQAAEQILSSRAALVGQDGRRGVPRHGYNGAGLHTVMGVQRISRLFQAAGLVSVGQVGFRRFRLGHEVRT
jgi:hypothetical protein